MSDGIRATVSFADPGTCPIANASRSTEGPIEQVSTSVALPDSDGSVSEFMADSDLDDVPRVEPVFSYGEATLYRVSHDGSADCPCETLGEFDCPVHRYVAEDGTLTLVFHAPEFETLQGIMDTFREEYPPVDVQRLLQPPLEGSPEDRVFVNRGRLTNRQREVLRVAFEMGYFRRPKGANATEIADALGIAQSTFTEHLVAAQRKLLTDILD
ncbi:HTH DNA binding domain [Halovenus aranensis]|jgi:predicted DNA binding protein|uniref:HTH DNA binding domain n=1 Tax=Halovenus aranensis TaxID=890420 RepID=A0A1G8V7R3_9EURY|nr:helix-turn-helix domain-containing protein [Halovenus aranensis]SDJ61200.1 HTH DNA binding domain [Halovenus aranensis]